MRWLERYATLGGEFFLSCNNKLMSTCATNLMDPIEKNSRHALGTIAYIFMTIKLSAE
jgi:hypothetical protein